MQKSSVMALFAVRSANDINYPAPERQRRRILFITHRLIPVLGGILIVGGAVAAVYIVLIGLDWTIMPLVVAVALLGFAGLLPAAYWLDSAPIDIQKGVLTFPYRTRRRDGTKTNRLALEEVVRATAVVEMHDVPNPDIPVTRAEMGLTVTLADGTAVFLAQARFGAQGLEVLQKIGSLHGSSYLDQTIESLRGSRYPRFHVWGVRGFEEEAILLSKKMRTYSSRRTNVLRAEDVLFVESVETDFAGRGYVFVRKDGILMFLRAEQVDLLRVWSTSAWANKLVE